MLVNIKKKCCCGNTTCGICGSEVKSSYSVDFGAGGWTDDGCDYCDQVVGEFVLGELTDDLVECCATYEDSPVCSYAASCETNKNMYFRLLLCIVDAGGGQLKWRLNVDINLVLEQNPSCPNEFARAVFESDPFNGTDCNVVPVDLNRTSQSLPGGVCGGSLPATITLDET